MLQSDRKMLATIFGAVWFRPSVRHATLAATADNRLFGSRHCHTFLHALFRGECDGAFARHSLWRALRGGGRWWLSTKQPINPFTKGIEGIFL